jgi:outer membrane receptor for ferrienterochelin and colicin
MKEVWRGVLLLGLCFVLAGTATAQTQITTGVIQGTVTDPSGSVIPGAEVEVKNLDTNYTRKFSTDADGRFIALLLPPGRYTVTVAMENFATLVQQEFQLTVGQTVSLSLNMKVSTTKETITVTDTPVVDTVKTESSTTLGQLTIKSTPILGRKFEDLLLLTPGVSIVQGPDGDAINFAGQRGIFTNISLDGGDYMNGFFGEQVGGQRASIDITLEAIKEFQVIPAGGSAEYGRTAGGIVNAITRSGTNQFHGSIFHYQRLAALSANTSDGKPLNGFHREQFGGTLGGPLVKDRAFWFLAVEQITANLQRDNLSTQLGGTACPNSLPVITSSADRALINSNPDCERLALINFMRTSRNQEEGLPVRRPQHNTAILGRLDWNVTPRNQLNGSWNFNRSNKINETFDVATYGNSANGTEGPSKINVMNVNFFTTFSTTLLNEAHFTYNRELRPRAATSSNVPADTAMGFVNTFRFGAPFFLQPNIDELFWRTQLRDNVSFVSGKHTLKFGGEWIHSLNDQTFRGFFTGRYIFDSTEGFLRYASPASLGPGFGPTTGECAGTGGTVWVDLASGSCPVGTELVGPLLLYLQDGTPTGLVNIPPGKSNITNEELGFFFQDKWQLRPNFTLNLGLRWEAQIFPDPKVPPSQTLYGSLLTNPAFPSDGTLHSDKKMIQPRIGFAWDIGNNQRSALRASWGIYNARQNMLTQVGSITTNGVQQYGITCATVWAFTCFGLSPSGPPTWPNIVPSVPSGTLAFGSDVRVFSKDYRNPRIYTTNVSYEFEIYRDWSIYADFTHTKGVWLTRFINENWAGAFSGVGAVFTAEARGKSLYRGLTIGMRKRFSQKYQLEWNYVLAKDMDDDSNERDPFVDRVCDHTNLQLDYALSDRDIRHKFNFFTYAEFPGGFQGNVRMQARTAQPYPGIVTPPACGTRNSQRKDTEYFSLDWRLQRPFRFGERYELTPTIEMFNTFNNRNNINPLVVPGLFNFDGFLRQGVGDPLQVQIAVRFSW